MGPTAQPLSVSAKFWFWVFHFVFPCFQIFLTFTPSFDHLFRINKPTDSSVSNYLACSFTIRLVNFFPQPFNLMWIHIKTAHQHNTS